jgi:diguanylate cyclase (GGDEF)-like protein
LIWFKGGKGFIVRLPVVRDEGNYWGQISVVLDAEKVFEALDLYARDSGLEIAIYHEATYPDTAFSGMTSMSHNNPLVFKVNPELMDWRIEVIPIGGWKSINVINGLIILGMFLLASVVGVIVYVAYRTNYELKQNSIHDSLTQLLNRHFLDDYQELITTAAIRRNSKIGMLLIDLDHFKHINDEYGHRVGDLVLIEVARLLKKTSRTNEAVFRLGGDEFLIIYPEVEDFETLLIAKSRVLKIFAEEFNIKSHHIKMEPSIGASIFPNNGRTFDEVLHYADTMMYDEKSVHAKENR